MSMSYLFQLSTCLIETNLMQRGRFCAVWNLFCSVMGTRVWQWTRYGLKFLFLGLGFDLDSNPLHLDSDLDLTFVTWTLTSLLCCTADFIVFYI